MLNITNKSLDRLMDSHAKESIEINHKTFCFREIVRGNGMIQNVFVGKWVLLFVR